MIWTALVLAGTRPGAPDPVAQATGAPCKALAEVAGRPMIAHVLDALRGSGLVGDILVSAERDAPALPLGGATRLDAGETLSASVLDAFDRVGSPLLVTTADHPLLSPATVAAFAALAERSGAEVAAGVARRETAERAAGAPPRTWLRLSDGAFSGCNLFALTAPAARGAILHWRRIEALRKRPLAMARALGPLTLARYALGRLGSGNAAEAVSRLTGARAAFVELDDPLAAHDVDKPADLAFAEATLSRRSRPAAPPGEGG